MLVHKFMRMMKPVLIPLIFTGESCSLPPFLSKQKIFLLSWWESDSQQARTAFYIMGLVLLTAFAKFRNVKIYTNMDYTHITLYKTIQNLCSLTYMIIMILIIINQLLFTVNQSQA